MQQWFYLGQGPAWILGLCLIFGAAAHAGGDLESYTEAGKSMFSEDVTVNGDGDAERGSSYNWSLDLARTKTVSTDPTTGNELIDNTTDVSVDGGYTSAAKNEVGGGLEYSSTPDENLSDFGPNLYLGTKFQLSEGKEAFHRDLGIRFKATTLNYVETLGRVSRRTGVTRKGRISIRQNAFELKISSKLFNWLTLAAYYTGYSYSRDPAEFVNALDSRRSLQSRTAGMSSTVTGFPISETRLKGTFYLPADCSLQLSETWAKSIVDGSWAYTTKILGERDFSDTWTLGAGLQNERSDDVKDNLALLDIDYNW